MTALTIPKTVDPNAHAKAGIAKFATPIGTGSSRARRGARAAPIPARWVGGVTPVTMLALWLTLAGGSAPARAGDRLLGTWGVSSVEGAGGGGLSPWALITGSGSRDQVAATAFATTWRSQGRFSLRAAGAAIGIYDTFELSGASWRFGLGDTVPGASIRMDTLGAKWRFSGDAVQDQDRWWPQFALGLQAKQNHDMTVPTALGAKRGADSEIYLSATKIWLAGVAGRNGLLNLTWRYTRANQFGLLGFGGDRSDARRLKPEVSGAVLLRDDLALGAEWRDKPDNLSSFREQPAKDLFIAWFASRHLSTTLAWLDLGRIADKPGQRGVYLSVQAAY